MDVKVIQKWEINGQEYERPNNVLMILVKNFVGDLAKDFADNPFLPDTETAVKSALFSHGPGMGELQDIIEACDEENMTISELEDWINQFMIVLDDYFPNDKYDKYSEICYQIAQMWG